MQSIEKLVKELQEYQGEEITIMEVCGSHTAAISKYGIRQILSPKIRLVSGPGCPVCVTPSAYIDRLISLAMEPDTCVVTFGDMLRVPGSVMSLSAAKGQGARVEMVYSPMDVLELAKNSPDTRYVFAAVGFETTAPIYTLLLEEVERKGFTNVQILTALKTMPNAIRWLMRESVTIHGFLAPGHVCTITGSDAFLPLAKESGISFAVAGFSDQELIAAIYGLVKMIEHKKATVHNFYPSVVTPEGNKTAQEKLAKYFRPADVVWRGMGNIPDSGLVLREEYAKYDAGSMELVEDHKMNQGCCCDKVLTGKITSRQCPLFGKVCTPSTPQGACMVSYEGSCYQAMTNAG